MALEGNQKLLSLNVSDNDMTDVGGRSFTSALLNNPFVREIDVAQNNVSARTARHLREILALRNSSNPNASQRSTEWIVQEVPGASLCNEIPLPIL